MSRVNELPWDDLDRTATALVAEAHANGGLAPLDVERFWADQKAAAADPFGARIPQCAVGSLFAQWAVFDELGVEEDYTRLEFDHGWRARLNRAYNDRAQEVVGVRPLPEPDPDRPHPVYSVPPPAARALHELFEAENVWRTESYWLLQSAHNAEELAALLDRVEERLVEPRACWLPEEWEEKKAVLWKEGWRPPRYRGQRGPVTFACSIYGAENLIFLIHDRPDLARRFGDLIARAIIGRARLLDEENGDTPETAPRGWGWADDNCCLLTPRMFEFFAAPIHRTVYQAFAPDPGDRRHQHSDSAMGHLLPALAQLGINSANFGPTVMVDDIRRHLPHAVIQGQLAPFTYSRNQEVDIVREFLRDFELTRHTRGLVFTTAGSINNGSRLTGARLIMAAVQRYGRFDG